MKFRGFFDSGFFILLKHKQVHGEMVSTTLAVIAFVFVAGLLACFCMSHIDLELHKWLANPLGLIAGLVALPVERRK